MNKKFSTLVASILLASSVGAYAQVLPATPGAAIAVMGKGLTQGALALEKVKKDVGYQVGKSYFLATSDIAEGAEAASDFLYIDVTTGGLKYGTVTEIATKYASSKAALWLLKDMKHDAGALNATYMFVNEATGKTLALDPSAAVSNADALAGKGSSVLVEGGQSTWLSADSYLDPAADDAFIYASAGDDKVIVMVAAGGQTGSVVLVKVPTGDMNDPTKVTNAVKIRPYVSKPTSAFTLSPNDLNTMLGLTGEKANKNSFFNLSISPIATVKGEKNIWMDDLQAVAVSQFELAYGQDGNNTFQTKEALEATAKPGSYSKVVGTYASLYPEAYKENGTFNDYAKVWDEANNNYTNNVTGFANKESQWVAVRNRDGLYLVVDTFSIEGTGQDANVRVSFKYDSLYNAKNETRYRDPRSYLFRFDYNPATKNVEVLSYAYVNKQHAFAGRIGAAGQVPASDLVANINAGYTEQPLKYGSRWYTADGYIDGITGGLTADDGTGIITGMPTTGLANKNVLSFAKLTTVTEATLGKIDPNDKNNAFSIKLGLSEKYVPTTKNGTYLVKVVGGKEANIGKYWINELGGSFKVMEQAARQNFQHMPATQWVFKSTAIGAPVTVTNREFMGVQANAPLYAVEGQSNQVFFMGGDTLQLEEVTKANLDNKYLGYKYIHNDSIAERTFTFNYLHQLSMDKPINTVDNKDSVVWVDINGEAINFVLEAAADGDGAAYEDDTYGVGGNLVRRAYNIKVQDASKLQNDKRYLCYDNDQKKYVLKEKDQKNADKFFLKENNEVSESGTCYYTLVTPRYNKATYMKVSFNGAAFDLDNATAQKFNGVIDDALCGLFKSSETKPVDPETGLPGTENKVFSITGAQVDEVLSNKNLELSTANRNEFLLSQLPASSEIILIKDDTDFAKKEFAVRYQVTPASLTGYYATKKVSVDNNTLNLVNGVLSDAGGQEVANSAFSVLATTDALYRRFNTTAEGEANDKPDTVKFYSVNANEYLFEDGNSEYSKEHNFNFLGIENKNLTTEHPAIYVDTAYVRGEKLVMPQYMLVVDANVTEREVILCDAKTHAHATEAEALACPHSKVTPHSVEGRFLVNLKDSVANNEGKNKAKYQYDNKYIRLGFVEATHIGDSLIIKNSVFTGNKKPIKAGEPTTIASKDTIDLAGNTHNNAVFSFRLVKSGSNDFLIESNCDKKGGLVGSWIKIQNNVPVLAENADYKEAGTDAEIFNVEKTTEKPTNNDVIDATTVSIEAGNGKVTIKNAEGKNVAISNILGQAIANTVITSDNATITVPAGIVVVSVEGEEAVKAIVK